MLTYFKSRDFPIHLLAAWWVFWLTASHTDLSEFIPPSGWTVMQFVLLIASFLLGYYVVNSRHKHQRAIGDLGMVVNVRSFRAGGIHLRVILRVAALACSAMLLASLYLSGAFRASFIEYFAKFRELGGDEGVTGSRALDLLTKLLAFPLSYTVILIVLGNGANKYKATLLICILNLLAFSYLWQVNYPVIHLFWLLVFYWLLQAHRCGRFNMRTVGVMFAMFFVLLASSMNRFGGDVYGALNRYIVGYHLIGFSFYDHHYLDPKSILHVHSFGRSSLGFLDQTLQVLSKMIGVDYLASVSENGAYNMDYVDIGLKDVRACNAFGTLLFGLYRDFHLLGILVGGIAYGALTTQVLYRSSKSWICGALFMLLAPSWMMGMMVDPLEQPYFWFAIPTIGVIALLDRGFRGRGKAGALRAQRCVTLEKSRRTS